VSHEFRMLTEPEAIALLSPYGLPFPPSVFAHNAAEATLAAGRWDRPLVLKVVSRQISHKSDVGGVRLGVGRFEVGSAYEELVRTVRANRPDAAIDGVLIEPQVVAGIEVLVGVKRDVQFGPVLAFGAGGVLAELLDTVALRLLPVTEKGAGAMIAETKVANLLRGVRGRPSGDVGAVRAILIGLSRFVEEHPEVVELDLNPVLVHPRGATVVDARIEVASPGTDRSRKERCP
jgi:succinyl-CoA synthetase beta subunit